MKGGETFAEEKKKKAGCLCTVGDTVSYYWRRGECGIETFKAACLD